MSRISPAHRRREQGVRRHHTANSASDAISATIAYRDSTHEAHIRESAVILKTARALRQIAFSLR
jgi:hypothetical protein